MIRKARGVVFALGLLSCASFSASSQSVSDYAVQVTAAVQTSPPTITLSWIGDPLAIDLYVYRKPRDSANWGLPISLAPNATSYVDTNVVPGVAYEYAVFKDTDTYFAEGYILTGVQAPAAEQRGKVVLLVDNTLPSELALELARLQHDLAGDGWSVIRHDVERAAVDPANTSPGVWSARSNELASVKALIQSEYDTDPANVKAVFLLGHLPVPYSGDLNPDGHADHKGAWPADPYYGDMTDTWSDSLVNNTSASDQRNWNVPGDGKFDNTYIPGNVRLQVGRVDFANLPAFPQGEATLLRQYLNKDHRFRQARLAVQRRGLIDDHFGVFQGNEPLAVNGWRNFAPLFGRNNIFAADWLTVPAGQSYLWGYGCGSGTYTSAAGVASTSDFVTNDTPIVFTMLFGSRFGDWDSPNNLMRAQLGTATYSLACAWVGRPYWYFHHLGLGETIGFSTRLCENGYYGYVESPGLYEAHLALLGDPTLRMHPVGPPSGLRVVSNGSGGAALNWVASPDAVEGYHVYSAPTAAGPFSRLTTNLVTGTSFTDSAVTASVYMVRAVKLEETPSGSYYNPSQGIFQSLDGSAGAPWVELFEPTNNASFGPLASIKLSASLLDPANAVTNVAFFANGNLIGFSSGPFYSFTWINVPGGTYSLTARALSSLGFQTNSSPVTIQVDTAAAPHLTIIRAGSGSNLITGDGVFGRVYTIQFADDLVLTNWQVLGTTTSAPSGFFQFLDSATATQRFYRTVYP